MESMPSQPLHLMNPMTSKFIPTLPFHLGCLRMNPLQWSKLFQLRASSSSTIVTSNASEVITEQNSRNGRTPKGVRGSKGILEAQFKEDWLHSSSSPFAHTKPSLNSAFKLYSASSSATIITTDNPEVITEQNPVPSRNGRAAKVVRGSKGILEAQLKEDWLHSLSCPFVHTNPPLNSGWVIGVDPDASGALALLKPDQSAQVFDSPQLKVLVGKGLRKRLDAKSIVQLLQSFEAPIGTTAYIERSTPYPQDGKQGWWGGGFGYGMWIGILVASGFSVIPVSSNAWKNEFQLTKERSNKDCSREVASALFPSLSSLLKRKKDHGRAEALLIAAYGKGLKINSDSFCTAETEVPLIL